MDIEVKNFEDKTIEALSLDESIYGLKPRVDLLHRAVLYQLAKRRKGTHKTKNRSEIAGTTKRVGRQKGGGTARHGSRKANIFIGGGKAHGPVVRSHAMGLPKKLRALALRHALSAKVKAGQLIVIDDVPVFEKTKLLNKQLVKWGVSSWLLVYGDDINDKFVLASRNIPSCAILPVMGINVYDILRYQHLFLTKNAVEKLKERFL